MSLPPFVIKKKSGIGLLQHLLQGNRRLLLRNLLLLRVIVIVFAGLFVFIAKHYLGWLPDLKWNALILPLMVFWSLLIWRKSVLGQSVSEFALLRELVLDGAWLFIIVVDSGRSANPFIYYYLVLIAITASLFSTTIAWLFSTVCIGIYTALLYVDINQHFQHMESSYRFHLLGMWINFVGSALVICYFVSMLAQGLRQQQQRLAEVREQTLKDEQLVAIGTIAASTVHALGTPLATLALLIEEQQELALTRPPAPELTLMTQQVQRCKDTLQKLTLLAECNQDGTANAESAETIAKQLQEHYHIASPLHTPHFTWPFNDRSLYINYNILLKHALINVIDNAVQAAKHSVKVNFVYRQNQLCITIIDDGEGIPSEVAQHLQQPLRSGKADGLGVGLFLANSTIEKMGGVMSFNRALIDGLGQCTVVRIVFESIELRGKAR